MIAANDAQPEMVCDIRWFAALWLIRLTVDRVPGQRVVQSG